MKRSFEVNTSRDGKCHIMMSHNVKFGITVALMSDATGKTSQHDNIVVMFCGPWSPRSPESLSVIPSLSSPLLEFLDLLSCLCSISHVMQNASELRSLTWFTVVLWLRLVWTCSIIIITLCVFQPTLPARLWPGLIDGLLLISDLRDFLLPASKRLAAVLSSSKRLQAI